MTDISPIEVNTFLTHTLVAVVGVLLARVFSKRSERIKLTLELYEKYNSNVIIEARNKSWRFLKTEYENQPIWELYSDKEQAQSDRYDALIQVSYFWYSLYILGKKRMVHKRLAKELFKQQFTAWHGALQPLYKATVSNSEKEGKMDEWQEFNYMNQNSLNWLKS